MLVTVIGDRIHDLELPPERRAEGGSGWVRRLRHLFALHDRDRNVEVVDATEPGNTAHKLRERWTDDVLLSKSGIVLVNAGMSDALGFCAKNDPYAKDAAGAVSILDELFARCKARSPTTRLIAIEPVLNSIDTSPLRSGPVAKALTAYSAAIRELTDRNGIPFLPAGDLIRAAKRVRNDDEWLGCDPAGLDTCGSMLMADAAFRMIAGLTTPAPTALEHGQTLLLIGDSITDAGRRGTGYPYGTGYVRLFQGLQAAREPSKIVRIINKGIGGDTIVDIESRWERDVTPYRPDWLVLYTGINDMNTIYGRPVKITPDVYREGLNRCIASVRRDLPNVRCLLVAPFMLTRDDHSESYRCEMLRRMTDYTHAVESVANAQGTRFLDLQAVMRPLMDRYGNRALGSNLGVDNIHPGELGCLAIAESMYCAFAA